MTDFNHFAGNYSEVLDKSLQIGGESSEYFINYKAGYFAALTQRHGLGPVLDFGCGVGNLSQAIVERIPSVRVDGFDVSADSIAHASQRLGHQGVFSGDWNALRPPYRYIIVSNVMHHVIPPSERPALVSRLAGLLAPEGRLVVFEHNPANPATRWVVSRCPFDTDAVLLRPSEMAGLMRQAGLGGIGRDYIVFFPAALAFLRPLETRLGWLPMGAQYCMTGVLKG